MYPVACRRTLGFKARGDTTIMPTTRARRWCPTVRGWGRTFVGSGAHKFQVSRSPARTSVSSRFSGGASGQAQRGSNAHDGW